MVHSSFEIFIFEISSSFCQMASSPSVGDTNKSARVEYTQDSLLVYRVKLGELQNVLKQYCHG